VGSGAVMNQTGQAAILSHPWLTNAAIALVDDVRDQLWWSLGSLAVVLALAFWHTRLQPEPRGGPAHGRGVMPHA
jgi:hypothetical protein